jgi:hypothetical protein
MEKFLLMILVVFVAVGADDIVEDASLDTVSWGSNLKVSQVFSCLDRIVAEIRVHSREPPSGDVGRVPSGYPQMLRRTKITAKTRQTSRISDARHVEFFG